MGGHGAKVATGDRLGRLGSLILLPLGRLGWVANVAARLTFLARSVSHEPLIMVILSPVATASSFPDRPNPFIPPYLVGRTAERELLCQILHADGDVLLAGVPGIGRRTLLRYAAATVGARAITIDCLQAVSPERLVDCLFAGIVQACQLPRERQALQEWAQAIGAEIHWSLPPRLQVAPEQPPWETFQHLLSWPQRLADSLDYRVVMTLANLPHLRSWDRDGRWEHYLRAEIQHQTRVSYALIATTAEDWAHDRKLEILLLSPLSAAELEPWLRERGDRLGLQWTAEAIRWFSLCAGGHFGESIALARRIWLEALARQSAPWHDPATTNGHGLSVSVDWVDRAAIGLMEDLSPTFESLLLLLPDSQVRLLESLALDPTDRPHAREYVQKHRLSRGGGLQGALASLQQKGLVYGPELGYRVALPLMSLWLRHRLGSEPTL